MPDGDADRSSINALAAHAAGDLVFQTDWMAENKFDSRLARAVHVLVYTACFLPVALGREWSRKQAVMFLGTIAGTHFATDSRRWHDRIPIWRDQALHTIAIALAFAVADNMTND